jgi:PAP2 superfamily
MNNNRRRWLIGAGAGSLTVAGLSGCGTDTYSVPTLATGKNAAIAWNETLIQAIRSGTLAPPMVARAIAMVHTAMYDAWTAFDARALPSQPLGKASFSSPVNSLNKEIATSFAAYRLLVDLYPAQQTLFDAQMASLGLNPANNSVGLNSPEGIGNLAAANLMAFRHTDGSNQKGTLAPGAYADYTGYAPVNGPGSITSMGAIDNPNRWQPLTFSNGRTPGFITPHWTNVKGFALTSGSQLRPQVSLPQFGSAAYKDQADEVIGYTANLNDQQKVIAEYWANGPGSETPPGHWCLFAQQVSARDGHSLDKDIKLFMMLGNALLDSSIVCWDCKRHYDSPRPITAIRTLYQGQTIKGFINNTTGVGDMPGELWLPYQLSTFITPPFAEFTSGHSTFSAAGAEILRLFTGSDQFGGSYTAAPGSMTQQVGVPSASVTLSWNTFTAAAEEAGMSRLYGGIHFMAGNTNGKSSGRLVADQVWAKAQAMFVGQA